MRLAENTGRKKSSKTRHLGQLCLAMSSQIGLRHVATTGKRLLSSYTSSTYPRNVVNFGPLAVEIAPV